MNTGSIAIHLILTSLIVAAVYGMGLLIMRQERRHRQRAAELAAGPDLADRVREWEGQ